MLQDVSFDVFSFFLGFLLSFVGLIIGLVISLLSIGQNTRASQATMFNSLTMKLLELEEKITTNDEDILNVFLNTLETLSFYFNKKYISQKDILRFYSYSIPQFYKDLLTDEQKEDKNIYPDLKFLYGKILDQKT